MPTSYITIARDDCVVRIVAVTFEERTPAHGPGDAQDLVLQDVASITVPLPRSRSAPPLRVGKSNYYS